MKKIIILFFIVSYFFKSFGQSPVPEFLLPLYFSDSKGNKDTVYSGYDLKAKYGLSDGDFGEKDIHDVPFKKELEVRLGVMLGSSPSNPFFKRFVEKRSCYYTDADLDKTGVNTQTNLYFTTKNLPVTISWDSSLIDPLCVYNSFFHRDKFSYLPYYKEQDRVYLRNSHGKFVITKALLKNKQVTYDKLSPSGDTMFCMILFLLDKNNNSYQPTASNDIVVGNTFDIAPNPVSSLITVRLNNELVLNKISICNLNGHVLEQISLHEINNTFNIDVAALAKGMYFLRIDFDDGTSGIKRFVKLE